MKQNGESSTSMHSKNTIDYDELLLQQTNDVVGYNYQKSHLYDEEGTSCTLQHFQDENIRNTTTLSVGTDIRYLEQNPFRKLPFRIIKTASQDEDSQHVYCRSVVDIISLSGNCAGTFRRSSFKNSQKKLEQKFGSEQVNLLEAGGVNVGSNLEMNKTCTENESSVAASCDCSRPEDDHVHLAGLNEPTLDDTVPNGNVCSSDDQLVSKFYDSAKQELLSVQVNITRKQEFCMKCNKDDKLFNCKCGIIVHEKCLGLPIEIRNPETFCCPFCTHRNAVVALGKVYNNVCQTKEIYDAFLKSRGQMEFEATCYQ